MKIEPTPDGDLNLCLEVPIEWMLLLSVLHDTAGDFDLAERVGGVATESCEDWREWVLPDLRERFGSERRIVEKILLANRKAGFPCPHTLTIPQCDFYPWYALLNHARLALEARWNFGPDPKQPAKEEGRDEFNAALFRERFYRFIQGHLLDMGIG